MTLPFSLRAGDLSVLFLFSQPRQPRKVVWDVYCTWALHVENSVHTLNMADLSIMTFWQM